jgi:peroxiredoxin
MAEERLVSVGDAAPGFRLAASTGGEIALADYLGQKQVALFFVRSYG